MLKIRTENQDDWSEVYALNEAAFETPAEANLVNTLREQAKPLVSLVAEIDGAIAGHILFSPVTLSGHPNLKMMGLAPMAVVTDKQKAGIGTALVSAGLEACTALGYGAIVVLGHPDYYPRFGFVPSSRYGIDSEYEVPEEVFMVVELEAEFLDGKQGRISYHAAFASV